MSKILHVSIDINYLLSLSNRELKKFVGSDADLAETRATLGRMLDSGLVAIASRECKAPRPDGTCPGCAS